MNDSLDFVSALGLVVLLGLMGWLAAQLHQIHKVSEQGDAVDAMWRAERYWKTLPVLPILWVSLVLRHRGEFGVDLAAVLAAWGAAWGFGRAAMRRQGNPAGLLAILTLCAVHVGVVADVGRSHVTHFTVYGLPSPHRWLLFTALALIGSAALYATLGTDDRRYEIWREFLSGRRAVLLGGYLAGGAVLMGGVQWVRHVNLPVYAPSMLAFALAMPVIIARRAERSGRALTLERWLYRWKEALAVAFLIILAPLLTFDFAPVLIMAVTFTVLLVMAAERRAAVFFALLLSLGLFGVYRTGIVPRLKARVTGMTAPWQGGSSQTAHSLWAIARGGIAGQSPGRLVVIRTERGGKHGQRPAITLAHNDGVFSALAETTGVVGIVCVLFYYWILFAWLQARARRSRSLHAHLWFTAVDSIGVLTAVWGALWSCGSAPMAGVAAPLLAEGKASWLLWGVLLAVSLRLAEAEAADSWVMDPQGEGVSRRAEGQGRGLSPVRATHALLLLAVVPYFSLATFRQESTLTQVFMNTDKEAWTAEAIASRLLFVEGGRILIDPRRDLKERGRARAALARRAIVAEPSPGPDRLSLRPAPENLRESDPSRLGQLLRGARREWILQKPAP